MFNWLRNLFKSKPKSEPQYTLDDFPSGAPPKFDVTNTSSGRVRSRRPETADRRRRQRPQEEELQSESDWRREAAISTPIAYVSPPCDSSPSSYSSSGGDSGGGGSSSSWGDSSSSDSGSSDSGGSSCD